jgi:hypothetical protein
MAAVVSVVTASLPFTSKETSQRGRFSPGYSPFSIDILPM